MASFAPDVLTQLGPLPVTNTLIHTLLVDALLIGTAIYLSKRIKTHPRGLQSLVEPLIEGLYSLTESIVQTKRAVKVIFPFVATFFIFIFISNFTGLMPGVGTIGFFPKEEQAEHKTAENNLQNNEIVESAQAVSADIHTDTESTKTPEVNTEAENSGKTTTKTENHEPKFVPLLRGATSDINVTLALASISVIATHVLSVFITGVKDYLSRYISINPIQVYIGVLELVAEVMKIMSLSFRLFGNIYAGEVALHTVSALFAFLAPLPFLLLESIVSVVQALVFSMLTLVFMSILTTPHHAHAEAEHH